MLPPTPMPGAGAPLPPGGAGPATMPGQMHGSMQQGMSGVKVGLEALQKALPHIPMGSKLHQVILKAVAEIGKHMEQEGGGGQDPAAMIQQLMELARSAKTQPGMAGMMPGAGAGGAPGGAPPPPSPPMGA